MLERFALHYQCSFSSFYVSNSADPLLFFYFIRRRIAKVEPYQWFAPFWSCGDVSRVFFSTIPGIFFKTFSGSKSATPQHSGWSRNRLNAHGFQVFLVQVCSFTLAIEIFFRFCNFITELHILYRECFGFLWRCKQPSSNRSKNCFNTVVAVFLEFPFLPIWKLISAAVDPIHSKLKLDQKSSTVLLLHNPHNPVHTAQTWANRQGLFTHRIVAFLTTNALLLF